MVVLSSETVVDRVRIREAISSIYACKMWSSKTKLMFYIDVCL